MQETRHIYDFGDVDFQTWRERYFLWWARFPVTTLEEFERTRWVQQRRRRELGIDDAGPGGALQGQLDVQEDGLHTPEDLDQTPSNQTDTAEVRQRRIRNELFNDWQTHVSAARRHFPDRMWEDDRNAEQFLRVWDGTVRLGSVEDDISHQNTPESSHVFQPLYRPLSANPVQRDHLDPALQEEFEILNRMDDAVISTCLFIAAKERVEELHALEFGGGVDYDRWRTRFRVWWGWDPLLSRHAFQRYAELAHDSSVQTWARQRTVYQRWCQVFEVTRGHGANRTQSEFVAIWYGPRQLHQEHQRHQLDLFEGLVIPHTPETRRSLYRSFRTALSRLGTPFISEDTFSMEMEDFVRDAAMLEDAPRFESWLIYRPDVYGRVLGQQRGNSDEDGSDSESDSGSDLPYDWPVEWQLPQMSRAATQHNAASPTRNRADSPTIPSTNTLHRRVAALRDLENIPGITTTTTTTTTTNNAAPTSHPSANTEQPLFTPINDATTAFLAFREYYRWSHTPDPRPTAREYSSYPLMTRAEFNTIYSQPGRTRSFFHLAAEIELNRDPERALSEETQTELRELHGVALDETFARLTSVGEGLGDSGVQARRRELEARWWWGKWMEFWFEAYRTMPTVGFEEFRVVYDAGRDIYDVVTRLQIERSGRAQFAEEFEEGEPEFELLMTQLAREEVADVAAGRGARVTGERRGAGAAGHIEPVVDMEID